MDLIIAIICLITCYFTGSAIERGHYKNIKKREIELYRKPFISYGKNATAGKQIKNSYLVSSSVVIGCDYFKSFLASLRNLFGGNVSAYESVLDRGRREAVLRIREIANNNNADYIINIKIETIMLDPLGAKQNPKVCVTAYGTAIEYAR